MMMFKPHTDSLSSSPIFFTIYHNNEVLFHEKMLPPDHLTKICTRVYTQIDADFSLPSHFDFILDDSEELQNSKDAIYFNNLIKEYDSINVVTYDGGHSPLLSFFIIPAIQVKKFFLNAHQHMELLFHLMHQKEILRRENLYFLSIIKGHGTR